jgi:hypothetical protein
MQAELVYDSNRGAQLDIGEENFCHLAGHPDTPMRRGVTGQITFMHSNASRYAHKERHWGAFKHCSRRFPVFA